MAGWFTRLTTIASADSDLQRRGRMVVTVALGMIALDLAFIPLIFTTSQLISSLITLLAAPLIFIVALLLGRAGQVDAGAYLLIGVTIVAISISIAIATENANTPFYMVLPVLLAGALLRPIQIWAILVLAILGIALSGALLPPEIRALKAWELALVNTPMLLVMIAFLAYLNARSTAQAIAESQQAQAEIARARETLLVANADLEAHVQERTAAIQSLLAEQQAVAVELEESLRAQRDLNRTIADLAVPIIPIRTDALIVPLIGNIGSDRAAQVLHSVLARLEGSPIRYVILDITGVVVVDTQVAGVLLQVAAATRLMGAETLLVGIRPEVAQALVHLGVDLSMLRTAASLQASMGLLQREVHKGAVQSGRAYSG